MEKYLNKSINRKSTRDTTDEYTIKPLNERTVIGRVIAIIKIKIADKMPVIIIALFFYLIKSL
jgi:hypothetical protein